MNWHELGGDPATGDVDAVFRVARDFDETAAESEILVARLRTIDRLIGPDCWSGPAAQEFRRLLGRLAPAALAMDRAYDGGADTVRSYATALSEAQRVAAQAATDAERAASDRDTANRDWHQAQDAVRQLANATTALRAAIATAQAARTAAVFADHTTYVAQLDAWLAEQRDTLHRAEADAAEARNQQGAAMQRLTAAMLALSAASAKADSARSLKEQAARRLVVALSATLPPQDAPQRTVGRAGAPRVDGGIQDPASGGSGTAPWLSVVEDAFDAAGSAIGHMRVFGPKPNLTSVAQKMLKAVNITELIRDAVFAYWDAYMDPSNMELSREERSLRAGGEAAARLLYAFIRDQLISKLYISVGTAVIPVVGTVVGAAIGSLVAGIVDQMDDAIEDWIGEIGAQGGTAIYNLLKQMADPSAPEVSGADDTSGAAVSEARAWA